MKNNCLVLLGAAAGGIAGHLLFFWVARQGFYGLVLPGGLVGIGAGLFRSRTTSIPIACGSLALALGLFTEWRFAPFAKDEGLVYFLSHLHQLKSITWIMILAGALIGFWVPFRRSQEVRKL